MAISVINSRGDKEQRLLEAAEHLFAEQGFQGTQVANITETSGVSIGTFYRNFKDKEDILKQLLIDFFADFRNRLLQLLQGIESLTPLEQFSMIRRALHLSISTLTERQALSLTLFRVGFGVNEEIDDMIWGFQSDMAQDLVRALTRVESAGLFVIQDKNTMANSIVGMVMQTSHSIAVEKTTNIESAVDICTRFILGGLMAFATEDNFDELTKVLGLLLRPGDKAA